MKSSNNTILITGGSAGIGFALAKLFSSRGNRIIITGRDEQRLQAAAAQLPNATAIAGDVSDPADVTRLVGIIRRDHPELNIVINNAGMAHAYDLVGDGVDAAGKAGEEMLTNYLSIVRLNELLLPLLKQQPAATIVQCVLHCRDRSSCRNSQLCGQQGSVAFLYLITAAQVGTIIGCQGIRADATTC